MMNKKKLEREINSHAGYLRKDMKAFWNNQIKIAKVRGEGYPQWMKDVREAQGYYFWEHGAKQFVEEFSDYPETKDFYGIIRLTDWLKSGNLDLFESIEEVLCSKAFLNCLSCFGEKHLEKLIKDEGNK